MKSVPYAPGIGLREIARNMDVPAGIVLARAKREGWTQQIQAAKARQSRQTPINQTQSRRCNQSQSTAERGHRYTEKMAAVAEKVVTHVQSMKPGAVLDRIEKVERFDRLARRTFGLDADSGKPAFVNIQIGPALQAAATAPTIDIQVDKL